MVLTTINAKVKKALLSIILVPIWDHVLQVEDDCKAHSSKAKPSGTVEKPSQTEVIELKFHGSKIVGNGGDAISYLNQFMVMQTPFDILSPQFATISEEINTSAGANSVRSELIRLDIRKILRSEQMVALGAKAVDIKSMLCRKNLKKKGSGSYVNGRTLKRVIDGSLCGVRKLLAYEASYLTSNGEIPSGSNEEDLVVSVLNKAYAALCYAKSKHKSSANVNDDDVDSDINGDVENEVSVLDANEKVPDDFVPLTAMPNDWTPLGWESYVVFACKTTRCTDRYLHVFSGSAKDMKKSGAKSRKQAKMEKRDESSASRNSADLLGSSNIGGVRGMTFERKTLVVNAGIKRSADKVFSLCANTAAYQKQEEKLIERKNQFMKQIELYQKMQNIEGITEKIVELMNKLSAIDNEISKASEDCHNATVTQTSFTEGDETGKRVDEFLAISLDTPNGNAKTMRRSPVPVPASIGKGSTWASTSSLEVEDQCTPTQLSTNKRTKTRLDSLELSDSD